MLILFRPKVFLPEQYRNASGIVSEVIEVMQHCTHKHAHWCKHKLLLSKHMSITCCIVRAQYVYMCIFRLVNKMSILFYVLNFFSDLQGSWRCPSIGVHQQGHRSVFSPTRSLLWGFYTNNWRHDSYQENEEGSIGSQSLWTVYSGAGHWNGMI